MGTGAVAFNVAPQRAVLCDANPHLINFYSGIASGEITPEVVKEYLIREGELLLSKGEDHYYFIRDRFNSEHSPLDFLFVNRAGFNGMIRFNRKGGFNIPFCRKPQRFAQAYVTKITNQVAWACKIIKTKRICFSSIKILTKPFLKHHHQTLFTATHLILVGMLITTMVGMILTNKSYLPGFLILKESLFYQHGITMITGKTNTLKAYGQSIPFLPVSIFIMLGVKRKTEILLLKP